MLLAKVVADADATIEWALPQGFSHFHIIGEAFMPSVEGNDVLLRVSTDGGANYAATGYLNATGFATYVGIGVSTTPTTSIGLSWISPETSSAAHGLTFDALLFGHAAGQRPRAITTTSGSNDSAQDELLTSQMGAGQYDGSTDLVTHVQLLVDSGNITSGTFYLYGEP